MAQKNISVEKRKEDGSQPLKYKDPLERSFFFEKGNHFPFCVSAHYAGGCESCADTLHSALFCMMTHNTAAKSSLCARLCPTVDLTIPHVLTNFGH